MKIVSIILILLLCAGSLFATSKEGMEVLTVSISFFAIGLGIFTISQDGVLVGVLQILIGIGGLVLVATDSIGGDLLGKLND